MDICERLGWSNSSADSIEVLASTTLVDVFDCTYLLNVYDSKKIRLKEWMKAALVWHTQTTRGIENWLIRSENQMFGYCYTYKSITRSPNAERFKSDQLGLCKSSSYVRKFWGRAILYSSSTSPEILCRVYRNSYINVIFENLTIRKYFYVYDQKCKKKI